MAAGKQCFLCQCKILNLLRFCIFLVFVLIIFGLYMYSNRRICVTRKHRLDTHALPPNAMKFRFEKVSSPTVESFLNCTPKQHIVFLKTHKTGASTVTNILNRFGERRDLVFALPRPPNHYKFGWAKMFDASFVDKTTIPKSHPDILCNHARLNEKHMKAIMPKDTVFITILRDPVPTFVSAFEAMDVANLNQIKGQNVVQQIENFFHNHSHYFSNSLKTLGAGAFLLRNGQFFDLGYQLKRVRTQKQVFPIIKRLEQIFDHVLITEYFDESLILMRRKFCWDLDDIVYFKLMEKASEETQLSATAEEKVRLLTQADGLLYEYFKQKILQEISNQGQDFFDEVEQLKEFNRRLKEKCIAAERFEKAPGSRFTKIKNYLLRGTISHKSKVDCCRMIRSEYDYVDFHRMRQQPQEKGAQLDILMGCHFEKLKAWLPKSNRKRLNRRCKPKEHILFLKTHKTGSSTVTNILNRFGDQRNLTFALPRPDNRSNWYRFPPRPFQLEFVDMELSTNEHRKSKPDILNNHARYNKITMETLMPADTAFITILREPVSNFESSFVYFGFSHICKITGRNTLDKIREFFRDPAEYYKKGVKRVGMTANRVRNSMMFDLGLESAQFYRQEEINRHIDDLEKKFTLVLILEHLNESLVLLKRKFCWELEDVVYFKFMSREKALDIPDELQEKILRWNAADKKLYDYFNRSLWRQVEKYGSEFHDEVKQLRELNARMKNNCLAGEKLHRGSGGKSLVRSGVLREGLNPQMKRRCCRFIREELEYVDYHRMKQGRDWSEATNKAALTMGC